MPTTYNEKHYRTDVVRLWRLERHEQLYRSEESCNAGGGKKQGGMSGSREKRGAK